MSESRHPVDVAGWVERAAQDPVAYRQRQTVEIILNAIAMTVPLNTELFLKGGILPGLAYGSPRQTTDIDLTAACAADGNIDDRVGTLLNFALPRAAASLGYADLLVRTQSESHFLASGIPCLEAQDRLRAPRYERRQGVESRNGLQRDRCRHLVQRAAESCPNPATDRRLETLRLWTDRSCGREIPCLAPTDSTQSLSTPRRLRSRCTHSCHSCGGNCSKRSPGSSPGKVLRPPSRPEPTISRQHRGQVQGKQELDHDGTGARRFAGVRGLLPTCGSSVSIPAVEPRIGGYRQIGVAVAGMCPHTHCHHLAHGLLLRGAARRNRRRAWRRQERASVASVAGGFLLVEIGTLVV